MLKKFLFMLMASAIKQRIKNCFTVDGPEAEIFKTVSDSLLGELGEKVLCKLKPAEPTMKERLQKILRKEFISLDKKYYSKKFASAWKYLDKSDKSFENEEQMRLIMEEWLQTDDGKKSRATYDEINSFVHTFFQHSTDAANHDKDLEQYLSILKTKETTQEILSAVEEIYKKMISKDDLESIATSVANNIIDSLEKLVPSKHYELYISTSLLPSKNANNILSFQNEFLPFCGRKEEIKELKKWLSNTKSDGISVWAVTGQGGSGKSRLALYLAEKGETGYKVVWVDKKETINLLRGYNNYHCPFPVLFICDYAAQYANELDILIERMSRGDKQNTQVNAKFLLLERSSEWYTYFLKTCKFASLWAYRTDAIDLKNSSLTDTDCKKIMNSLASKYYKKEKLSNKIQQDIIRKATALSNDTGNIRCLFLLLLTDAYYREGTSQSLSTDELVERYLKHTEEIVIGNDNYNYKNVIREGYHVLAYATAQNGIEWESDHPAIKKDLGIMEAKIGTSTNIMETFFEALSESSRKKGIISPLKPDLLGEYLFLREWDDISKPIKKIWLSCLLSNNYCREFFAHCLTNWNIEKANQFCTALQDIAKQPCNNVFHCVEEIFGLAACFSDSIPKKDKYTEIKEKLAEKTRSVLEPASFVPMVMDQRSVITETAQTNID